MNLGQLLGCCVAAILLGGGCKTNDFKVVDALRTGMSQEEARGTISGYGFERGEFLVRPADGWSGAQTTMNLPERTAAVEERRQTRIGSAEYYPVTHGFLGYGQLFLFYDENGRLVEFYRININ